MLAKTENPDRSRSQASRIRSVCWSGLLLPFLFLPYRWLWLPCALGAVLLTLPRDKRLNEILRRDGTLTIGSLLVLVLRTALDPLGWLPWAAIMACLMLANHWWTWRLRWGVPLSLLAVGASAGLLAGVDDWLPNRSSLGRPSPDTVIVCAGDSLTSGVTPGSDADTYVARLRERLVCQVINAGRANDRVGDLLKRLDKMVLSHRPTLVVLFIGGNDYLDGTPRRRFAGELEEAVSRIVAAGCRLVIVEVPSGII
jgi:hypothetical protein